MATEERFYSLQPFVTEKQLQDFIAINGLSELYRRYCNNSRIKKMYESILKFEGSSFPRELSILDTKPINPIFENFEDFKKRVSTHIAVELVNYCTEKIVQHSDCDISEIIKMLKKDSDASFINRILALAFNDIITSLLEDRIDKGYNPFAEMF